MPRRNNSIRKVNTAEQRDNQRNRKRQRRALQTKHVTRRANNDSIRKD